ncbi:recombinase family protein [Dyadobacter sediminis]|uniref:recombinase family protein n=1 Tax=Dyadobacter sediminis TaxID=1493691 RepID=UPI001997D260|nr:recombinase family protein [Dyadobacter sediminis]GGC06501.1 hypothetical protein GCM10011325_36680 [Dyadobacter sediminis]
MIYAYIRVSTDKQTVENQRYEILKYSSSKRIHVDDWIEEIVSGSKRPEDRKLGNVLTGLKKNDILIVRELSRLGRNLMKVMSILHICMQKECKVFAIKEGYELGNNIYSKVLALLFPFQLR